MNRSPAPTGWSAGTQKTITSTSARVSRTTSLSRRPSRLFGLCSPGVSTRTSWPPGRCTTPRMACRVVCGRLLTMPTFVPTRALVSVVLPALGRPTRQAKPLRYGGWSGGVTPAILPPGDDTSASPVPGGTAGRLGSVAQRSRDGRRPSAEAVDTARRLHVQQVAAHRFLAGLGPKRTATTVPAPLRYWQYRPARPIAVAFTLAL